MTLEELQKLTEEIAIKVNTLATIQLTIATTVNEGFRMLLRNSETLLEIARYHQQRLDDLEKG
jgi:hypothetical protein